MSVKSLIFDFDGTLYPKKGYAFRVFLGNLTSLKCLIAERKARKKLHGVYFETKAAFYRAFFREGAALSGHTEAEFKKWYKKYLGDLLHILKTRYRAYPEALKIFKICREKGISLFVYSDYNRTVERMEAIGIDPTMFEAVADSPSFGGLKPSIEAFERFMAENRIDPEGAVLIGDSDTCDRSLAAAAGMGFISVKEGNWDSVFQLF